MRPRPGFRPARSTGALVFSVSMTAVLLTACSAPTDTTDGGPSAASAPSSTPTPVPEGYAAEIASWREHRVESLTQPDGWLSLVGLYWLQPGDNRFGSAETNDLVFPAKAPARVGVFHLRDGQVTVEAEDDAGLETESGEPVTRADLAADSSGDPTVLRLGSLVFYVIERGDRLGVRVKDTESPALAAFQGLDSFPIDPAWRVEARLQRADGMKISVPNVLGQVEEIDTPGRLVFRAPGDDGRELSLVPIPEGDELFIVFGDPTNGKETYGGGRFLYADAPAADDPDPRVILDFNEAYNPPCAFTPFATCPLPPRPNKLPIPVEAGEKRYAGEVEHAGG